MTEPRWRQFNTNNAENTMNDSECNEGGSGSDGTSRPPERTVPCTAVRQIAEWLQEVEACLKALDEHDVWGTIQARPIMAVNATRLRSIMDAINASQAGGTKPTS